MNNTIDINEIRKQKEQRQEVSDLRNKLDIARRHYFDLSEQAMAAESEFHMQFDQYINYRMDNQIFEPIEKLKQSLLRDEAYKYMPFLVHVAYRNRRKKLKLLAIEHYHWIVYFDPETDEMILRDRYSKFELAESKMVGYFDLVTVQPDGEYYYVE